MEKTFTLSRKKSQLLLRFHDASVDIPVKVVRARPLTAPDGEISFLNDDKKEVAYIENAESLDPVSAALAREELSKRYFMPRITQVFRAHAEFGSRFFEVETEAGFRHFALRESHKNALWITGDHLILRDTIGNRYEIPSIAGLDERSQTEIGKVL